MYRQQSQAPQDAAARPDALERVGRIVAVTGAHAVILIDAEDNGPHGGNKSPEIGTLLKVDMPKSCSLCMVSALSSPMPSHSKEDKEIRIIEVEFIGELPKDAQGAPLGFRRGISCYPLVAEQPPRGERRCHQDGDQAEIPDSIPASRQGHERVRSRLQQLPALIEDRLVGR